MPLPEAATLSTNMPEVGTIPDHTLRQSGFWHGRLGHAILATATAAGLSGAGVLAESAPAAADNMTFHVQDTDSFLYLHPDAPTLSGALSDHMPDATNFSVDCFAIGDSVAGDNVWLYGTNESTGDKGYASDNI